MGFVRCLFWIVFFVLGLSIPGHAWYYKLYQKRLVPIEKSEPKRVLSNEQLGDATYYNQEQVDKLRAELKAVKVQLKKQQKNQKRLEEALIRFRNYYFRNI